MAPSEGGGAQEHEAEARAQLLHQTHPVLDLQPQGGEVLQEGLAVHELDGGARAVGGGQGLHHEVVVGLAERCAASAPGWGRPAARPSRPKVVEECA